MLFSADGGSTKTNWCIIESSGKQVFFDSEGYNPYFVDSDYIVQSLRKIVGTTANRMKISKVYFYGAGVQNEEKAVIIKQALKVVFPNSTSYVGHDLLASARALLGSNAGFSAILGTGTNTCLYDGSKITHHVDSGAHILGDEGSGFYMGKKLLIDYIRGHMPQTIAESFKAAYQLTTDDIHEAVYSKPLANRYCAGFSKFITESNLKSDYIYDLVKSSFEDFFKKIVSKYPSYQDYTFNCIGSVGYNFRDILTIVATEWGMETGKIIKSPLINLIEFHTLNDKGASSSPAGVNVQPSDQP